MKKKPIIASQQNSFLTEKRIDKIVDKINVFFENKKKSCVETTCSLISAQNLAIHCTNKEYTKIETSKEKMATTSVTSKNFNRIFKKINWFIFISSEGRDFKGAVIFKQMPEVLIIDSRTPEKIFNLLHKKHKELYNT